MSGNDFNKHKRQDTIKWVTVFVLVALLLVGVAASIVGVFSNGYTDWTKFKIKTDNEAEASVLTLKEGDVVTGFRVLFDVPVTAEDHAPYTDESFTGKTGDGVYYLLSENDFTFGSEPAGRNAGVTVAFTGIDGLYIVSVALDYTSSGSLAEGALGLMMFSIDSSEFGGVKADTWYVFNFNDDSIVRELNSEDDVFEFSSPITILNPEYFNKYNKWFVPILAE